MNEELARLFHEDQEDRRSGGDFAARWTEIGEGTRRGAHPWESCSGQGRFGKAWAE
jgi:hypothetical protein